MSPDVPLDPAVHGPHDADDPVARLQALGARLAVDPPGPRPSVDELMVRALGLSDEDLDTDTDDGDGDGDGDDPSPWAGGATDDPTRQHPARTTDDDATDEPDRAGTGWAGDAHRPTRPVHPTRHPRRGHRQAWSLLVVTVTLVVAGLVSVTFLGGSASMKFSTVGSAISEGGGPYLYDPNGGSAPPATAPGQPPTQPPAQRHQIRTATLALVVESVNDLAPAADQVVAITTDVGGQVADDNRSFGPGASANLVLRVPPDQLEAVVDRLEAVATVESSSIDTADVTEQYTDLENRIATLQRSIERVQVLIAEANDVVAIASLENELRTREMELESLTGQLRVLSDQVDQATVTVRITTRTPAPAVAPPVDESVDPPAPSDALRSGWSAFGTSVAWLTAGVLATLPFLVTALVAVTAWRATRRFRRRHAPTPA